MAENSSEKQPNSNMYFSLVEDINEMRSLSKKHIDRALQLRAKTAAMELDIIMLYTPNFILEIDLYKDKEYDNNTLDLENTCSKD